MCYLYPSLYRPFLHSEAVILYRTSLHSDVLVSFYRTSLHSDVLVSLYRTSLHSDVLVSFYRTSLHSDVLVSLYRTSLHSDVLVSLYRTSLPSGRPDCTTCRKSGTATCSAHRCRSTSAWVWRWSSCRTCSCRRPSTSAAGCPASATGSCGRARPRAGWRVEAATGRQRCTPRRSTGCCLCRPVPRPRSWSVARSSADSSSPLSSSSRPDG